VTLAPQLHRFGEPEVLMLTTRALLVAACFVVATCGAESSELLLLGGATDSGDPSVVAIFAHQPNASVGSLCTATVISRTALLTAAHCVDPRTVGTGNIFEVFTGTSLNAATSRLSVASTVFDPAFDPNDLQAGHDIAIVKLARPTALPPVPFNRRPLPESALSSPVRLIGYGTAHVGGSVGSKRTVTTSIDGIDELLVHVGSSNKSSCHGDSGGPALQVIDGKEMIVGVTSFGTDFSQSQTCFFGGRDTRVDRFADFIVRNL
jgi:secreted trypsin-like serine protease